MGCDCREDEETLKYIQGDTFNRQVTVENSSGEAIEPELIAKVEFLLLTVNRDVEETHELTYDSLIGKWVINADTSNWSATTHIMRYRITYTDGKVSTPYTRMLQIEK